MGDDITLSYAIKQLRAQLEEAQKEGEGHGLRFLTKGVELELNVVFKSELEGSAGVKAWFLDTSLKARGADERTHKVKLFLEPLGPDGKPTQVSDRDHENG